MDEFAQSRFRLEARYRHVLVDEFQDTSRAQWELVAHLVRSWGEGLGAAADALPPSIFIVGDRKQSIYGFRDADVAVLDEAAAFVERPPGRRRSATRHLGQLPRGRRRCWRSSTTVFDASVGAVDASGARATRSGTTERDSAFARSFGRMPASTAKAGPAAMQPIGPIVGRTVGPTGRARGRRDRSAALGPRPCATARPASRRPAAAGGRRHPLPIARQPSRVREGARAARRLDLRLQGPRLLRGRRSAGRGGACCATWPTRFRICAPRRFLRSRIVRLSDAALARLWRRRSRGPARSGCGRLRSAAIGDDDRRVLERLRDGGAAVALAGRSDDAVRAARLRLLERDRVRLRAQRDAAGGRRARTSRSCAAWSRGSRTAATRRWRASPITSTSWRVGDESNAAIDARDSVSLMTVHAAKGLEFPIVFLVNIGRGTGGAARADSGGAPTRPGEASVAIADYPVGGRRGRAGARSRRNQAAAVRGAHARARSPLSVSLTHVQDGRLPDGSGVVSVVGEACCAPSCGPGAAPVRRARSASRIDRGAQVDHGAPPGLRGAGSSRRIGSLYGVDNVRVSRPLAQAARGPRLLPAAGGDEDDGTVGLRVALAGDPGDPVRTACFGVNLVRARTLWSLP